MRQQAYWFAHIGVDVLGIDWTNNLWNTPTWADRAPNVQVRGGECNGVPCWGGVVWLGRCTCTRSGCALLCPQEIVNATSLFYGVLGDLATTSGWDIPQQMLILGGCWVAGWDYAPGSQIHRQSASGARLCTHRTPACCCIHLPLQAWTTAPRPPC